jgi:hypothetical protein
LVESHVQASARAVARATEDELQGGDVRKPILACTAAAIVAGATSATAASLVTSKQIKNGTIQDRAIKKGTITASRLALDVQAKLEAEGAGKSVPGPAGATGAQGETGAPGPKGDKRQGLSGLARLSR